jgi:diguanylate cyclase (GGDEF)-like protein
MAVVININNSAIRPSYDVCCIRLTEKLRKFFAAITFLMVSIVYTGYIFHLEALYRFFPNGPATHELTALCVGMLAVTIFYEKLIYKRKISLILAGVTGVIALLRAVELSIQGNFISCLTPFHVVAEQATKHGISHSMGSNTVIAVLSLSLSLLFRRTKPVTAFLIGSVAPFILVASMVGYTYNAGRLHGAMSLNTMFILIPLCFSFFMLWAHHPFARGIFARNLIGYSSRIQILFATTLPWLGGLILIWFEPNINKLSFAFYSTSLTWITIGLILLNVVQLERKDRTRRCQERQLLELSTTDQLTGCYNRRVAIEFGQLAVMQTKRSERPISVLMMDIDNFKRINDTYGHLIGDEVLHNVAAIAKQNLRGTDIVTRWGGEEFVILLHDSGSDGAFQVAEKIRSEVENMHLNEDKHMLPKITLSIGYVTYQSGSNNFSNMVKCADEAMYFAKQNGKNRVIEFSDKVAASAIAGI